MCTTKANVKVIVDPLDFTCKLLTKHTCEVSFALDISELDNYKIPNF
jgi:hypothetical protein